MNDGNMNQSGNEWEELKQKKEAIAKKKENGSKPDVAKVDEVKKADTKPETKADTKADTKAETSARLSKGEIETLEYFCNLPVERRKALLDDNGIEFATFEFAVLAHQAEALEDEELAIEKMLAEQAPKKAGEKMNLLENRYRASIEAFAKKGITPVMMATHLTAVERKNYPKRPKMWRFTPAMVSRFMKDNDIITEKK